MIEKIKITYLDDQKDMRDGLDSFFKAEMPEFDVQFVGDEKSFLKKGVLNIEFLETVILKHCPHVIIVDNDLGANQYDDEIVALVKKIMKKNGSKILLIGCSAYADAKGWEKKMIAKGFDRFFDNVGSPEHLCIICDYIKKSVKL